MAYAQSAMLHICVDLASAPDGIRRITGERDSHGAQCLLGDARTTNASGVSPWILACPSDRINRWLPRSVALAREFPAVTWLFGPLPTGELVSRMKRRADVQFADGSELILRFFDPRILFELNAMFSKKTHLSFFSLTERWCALDRDGSMFEVTSEVHLDGDSLKAPVALNEVEERALLLASEAGQVLAETLKRWPGDLLNAKPQARFELAKVCCSEAESMGFDNLADKVLFLMHVAAQPPGYLQTPEWFELRELLRGGQRTLISLFEESETTP